MASPLTTDRNKYHQNRKNNCVETPPGICNFIYEIVKDCIKFTGSTVLDTSVGTGNLLQPFCNHPLKPTLAGFDITNHNIIYDHLFFHKNFLQEKLKNQISLVVQNPPFNNSIETQNYLKSIGQGNALLPELFTKKVFDLYGQETPMVLITPMGFRLNQRRHSDRFKSFRDEYNRAKITGVISLPLDIFSNPNYDKEKGPLAGIKEKGEVIVESNQPNIEVQAEIIFWNIPCKKFHYWVPDKYIDYSRPKNVSKVHTRKRLGI